MAGKIDPGNVKIVREILSTPGASDVDTAAFSGAMDEYDISTVDGVTTVTHVGGRAEDGTDRSPTSKGCGSPTRPSTLSRTLSWHLLAPAAPTAVGGNTTATVSFAAPAGAETLNIVVRTGNTVVNTIEGIASTETSLVVVGLTNGTAYNFQVEAVNAGGTSPRSAASNVVTPAAAASSMRLNDFNGDGKTDVISRDSNGVLWLYPGTGTGDWLTRIDLGGGWNVMTSIVSAGDFNGDGDADVDRPGHERAAVAVPGHRDRRLAAAAESRWRLERHDHHRGSG